MSTKIGVFKGGEAELSEFHAITYTMQNDTHHICPRHIHPLEAQVDKNSTKQRFLTPLYMHSNS